MTPREVAIWLNNCSDEEFVETFSFLNIAMNGRHVPDDVPTLTEAEAKAAIKRLDSILTIILEGGATQ